MSERTTRERLAWAIDDTAMFLAEEAEEDGDQEKAEDHRRDVYRKVDAILAELREPDAAMVDAAYEVPTYWMHDVTETKEEWHDEFRQAWRAAIDAVRGEGQDGVSRRSRAP